MYVCMYVCMFGVCMCDVVDLQVCEVLDISDCGILLSAVVGHDKVFMLVCLYLLQPINLDGVEKYP